MTFDGKQRPKSSLEEMAILHFAAKYGKTREQKLKAMRVSNLCSHQESFQEA